MPARYPVRLGLARVRLARMGLIRIRLRYVLGMHWRFCSLADRAAASRHAKPRGEGAGLIGPRRGR